MKVHCPATAPTTKVPLLHERRVVALNVGHGLQVRSTQPNTVNGSRIMLLAKTFILGGDRASNSNRNQCGVSNATSTSFSYVS